MLGIHYLKASPTQYVLHYQNGRLVHAGTGLAFFYYRPSSSIAVVPVASADAPFIFNEMSADYQALTIQGQLTYWVTHPQVVASLLNYAVEGAPDRYLTEDPQKLPLRLINLAQVLIRAEIQQLPLRQAIQASDAIAAAVLKLLNSGDTLATLGVEVLALAIQSIRPMPEMTRALEAEAREELLRRADLAIYDRRNAAVEQERRIKENELNTEVAVEAKKRQIREAKIDADLAAELKEQQVRETALQGQIRLESEKIKLVSARVENERAKADSEAYAIAASLRPLQALEPALLEMLSLQNSDPRRLVSVALKEIARNASKIGNLNISPDLMEMLMDEKAKR